MDDAERFVTEMERRHAERRRTVQRLKRAPATAVRRIRQFFGIRHNPPQDPYAYVMARVKPKPPHFRASAVVDKPSF